MQHGVRLRVQHYRELASHFRSLAETEPLASLRWHLRRLAAQHDEMATDLEDEEGAPRAALG
jgi:hypothetical protein